ncbi:MAG: hypothetical protein ABIQ33_11860, partial [Caldimonas sp.]
MNDPFGLRPSAMDFIDCGKAALQYIAASNFGARKRANLPLFYRFSMAFIGIGLAALVLCLNRASTRVHGGSRRE